MAEFVHVLSILVPMVVPTEYIVRIIRVWSRVTIVAISFMYTVPVEEQCLTGDVQLVNGSSLAGRLEVCFNGVWGTVCHFGWTAPAATVVCKQLGFDSSGVEMY